MGKFSSGFTTTMMTSFPITPSFRSDILEGTRVTTERLYGYVHGIPFVGVGEMQRGDEWDISSQSAKLVPLLEVGNPIRAYAS